MKISERSASLIIGIALIVPQSASGESADEALARNQRGLQIIQDFAGKACPLPLSGKLNDVEVRAEADAELTAALKKLVDAKLEAAVKYKHEDAKASLLSADVLPALKDRAQCFERLVDRLGPIFLQSYVPASGSTPRPPSPRPSASPPRAVHVLPDVRGLTFRAPVGTVMTLQVANDPKCTERETYSEAIQFSGAGNLTTLSATRYIYQQSERCYVRMHTCKHDPPRKGGYLVDVLPTSTYDSCMVDVPTRVRRIDLVILSSNDYTETVIESPSDFYLPPLLSIGTTKTGKVEFLGGNNQVIRFDQTRSYSQTSN